MSTNRLAQETSPYLLQHKDNPVDWHPWGEEALALAKQEDKPILLSVGYAACHWCHVMAHESFENPAIAEQMNELFINIKVDREERPDIDTIYQQSVALLGEQGGWPLTVFLTPEGEPFWGGTYFPPEARYGRPGFPQVLDGIASAYRDQRETIGKNVANLKEGLKKLSESQRGVLPGVESNELIAKQLTRQFDPFHGGLGSAPKFPQCSILKLIWSEALRNDLEPCRHAMLFSLTQMSQGGIYDHLGGGYARYSVDDRWLVPHFEKMLYDNAQLLDCLTLTWQDTGEPLFEQRARETVGWLLREMMAEESPGGPPCGAFASTLDADSEGEEGKFYVWTEAEIDALLQERAPMFKAAYDVHTHGNWEGKTILNRSRHLELGDAAQEAELAACREILLAARDKERVRPGWDDKVLADWNGLMIAALARSAPVFKEDDWLAAAERAFAFVQEHMQSEGRLSHSWRHGTAKHAASIDDYAAMCDAALALYEATGKSSYLAQAEAWAETVERHYVDPEAGGYFFTPDDAQALVVRSRTAQDNATPAGNAVMAGVIARLFHITGKPVYRERAERTIGAFAGDLAKQPFAYPTLLMANALLQDAVQIVIVGERAAAQTAALLDAVYSVSLPDRVLTVLEPGASLPESHPAFGKDAVEGKSTAYVCRGTTCSLPITEPGALQDALCQIYD